LKWVRAVLSFKQPNLGTKEKNKLWFQTSNFGLSFTFIFFRTSHHHKMLSNFTAMRRLSQQLFPLGIDLGVFTDGPSVHPEIEKRLLRAWPRCVRVPLCE
jgi:hypothetical protein